MPDEKREKESIRPIEALQKGLVVLQEIGRQGGNISALAKATAINRTTIYRILRTLETEGYVARAPSDHRFRLTPKVKQLSHGFTDALWVTHIAMPILLQLLRDTSWPGNVATFDGRNMVFRESSHRFSSYLVHRPLVGTSIPMSSSLGQAYLAFSSPAVRKTLLPNFAADWEASNFGALTSREAERTLADVRERGYATALHVVDAGVGGIAMPVIRDKQVLACFGVTAPAEVISAPQLLRPLVEHLRTAVSRAALEMSDNLY